MKKCNLESKNNNFYAFNRNHYESNAWKLQATVCGIDEVGRGCLAGPLVTAAVILPIGTRYRFLKDSKALSAADREKAYKWIIKNAHYSVGITHNRTVDHINIWQATLITMKKALIGLLETSPYMPQTILVDAMPLDILDTKFNTIPVEHFTKGESRSISIAAASIVAKVTRDRMMQSMDSIFPGYKLADHKGYGTKAHLDAIRSYKHSITHRTSFLKKINQKEANSHEKQQSIC